ncbi:MAG: Hsp20/alpha crystallin family protein [Alphaproteobacteria bacterium]|nr:MAG: Hsp20/alpha crystallin family protein [Alphaproteobacteria bacterium]
MAQDITTTARQDVARGERSEATTRTGIIYRPNTDIYETADHVVLVADMPGVSPQDVDVTLERQVLTIRGRLHAERPSGYRPIYAEYGEGDFERVFTLSQEIDRDRIEARHNNGTLVLKLPKADAAKTKKIAIKTG